MRAQDTQREERSRADLSLLLSCSEPGHRSLKRETLVSPDGFPRVAGRVRPCPKADLHVFRDGIAQRSRVILSTYESATLWTNRLMKV
jgi:hypothetical protein